MVRGRTPREVLNELRFRNPRASPGTGGLGLEAAEVTILHRTGPESRPILRNIRGSDILRLDRGFFYTPGGRGETAIPYHRVRSILFRGCEVWRRPASPR